MHLAEEDLLGRHVKWHLHPQILLRERLLQLYLQWRESRPRRNSQSLLDGHGPMWRHLFVTDSDLHQWLPLGNL